LAPLLTNLNVIQDPVSGLLNITLGGALGDLFPVFGIPGQIAQNTANLIPGGSVPAMVAQNATNLFTTVTDLSQTLDLNTGELHIGLPLAVALDALGPPVTTLQAVGGILPGLLVFLPEQQAHGIGAAPIA
jgi:hypothetical protein